MQGGGAAARTALTIAFFPGPTAPMLINSAKAHGSSVPANIIGLSAVTEHMTHCRRD